MVKVFFFFCHDLWSNLLSSWNEKERNHIYYFYSDCSLHFTPLYCHANLCVDDLMPLILLRHFYYS